MNLDSFIPYGTQDITKKDIDAVIQVLKSDFLTQGPCVPNFEKAVAQYCNAKYSVAVNSATSALHLACLALDLQEGDWLWTSSITFVASANCALYCGAKVDLVDIDPSTYNLCPVALEKKLIYAKKIGQLPKIVIPVHLCGQSCDMKSIHKLSQEYGFKVIEDASHAIGGRYLNKAIGSCEYSDITVFSFHPVKIITTAEGGMALTNNSKIANKISLLRSHGITRETEQMSGKSHGDWYYQQIALGFNYRMTDLQAALGLSQLNRLDNYVLRRNFLANRYDKQFENFPLTTPYQLDDTYSARHLYVIRINDHKKHKKVFDYLKMNKIGVNLHYIPLHFHPVHKKTTYSNLPHAESYYKEAITLPLFPKMTEDEQNKVINLLGKALKK